MKRIIVLTILFTNLIFANSLKSNEFVRVTHSEPIYKEVRINKPIQECYEKEYRQKIYDDNYSSNNNSIGIDTIVGVTAGAILGNQIGKGNGNTAAKIVGGLIGGKIANELRSNSFNNYHYETRYETKYEKVRTKRVITGYRNYFNYDGIRYSKVTKNPKKRIRVYKTIDF
ncbi:hypothetical protein CPU12_01855 [Malaciobacter molluscorum LMG 25693]|uniref:Glycine zipper 2TM domain-containing protein n=1 Tax=Malaciobacter molluscorum LMG 25693 TaxID=870501 RepID=A0A2G1DKG7_9BACT|nr:glycine zipper 2TM domain-containing protein [Malaciobacter molluscorum]AXX92591.1 glycine zipper 2TM domain-containing protein [Malaciobacter molluscorum LMG 25693]PHO19015.1 hypothetical protein CPU12_01855 [Malaciobacter molluscorum LMG 25693]